VSLLFKDQGEEFKIKKLQIVKELIKENHKNGEYWVFYGIFISDYEIKLRSFYKAL
jgi:hypothetical protein